MEVKFVCECGSDSFVKVTRVNTNGTDTALDWLGPGDRPAIQCMSCDLEYQYQPLSGAGQWVKIGKRVRP